MIFVFQNLLEHDISKEESNTLLYQLSQTYFLQIGQEQTSLLNRSISTQRRPHARPRAMPRALLSVTNNSPKSNKNFLKFYFEEYIIKNTKIFQVSNELLSCTRIRSRLQFLLRKGYRIGGLNECPEVAEMAPKYNARSGHTTTTRFDINHLRYKLFCSKNLSEKNCRRSMMP